MSQIKAARALLDWTKEELSEYSGFSLSTVKRIELSGGERRGHEGNYMQIQKALEEAGIEFISENGGGPGVRLKKKAE